MKLIELIKWVWLLLSVEIWKVSRQDMHGWVRWVLDVVRAIFKSVEYFLQERLMEKASALTYYTMLAIVPMFALLFGIASGFNLQGLLEDALKQNDFGMNDTMEYIVTFANGYLEQAKSGVIVGIGLVMLMWVLYSLIGNIESVFNHIWQQKRSRTIKEKITTYLSIIIVVPILVLFGCGLQAFSRTLLDSELFAGVLSDSFASMLSWVPYLLIILTFTLVYMIIPNVKVKFINALIAGAVAGTGFLLFENLFMSGQLWVSKNNAIYGSFAALPLLLLWLQMSWVICLYGAKLSFTIQNLKDFEFEKDIENIQPSYYHFLCCCVASLIYNRFDGEMFTTKEIGEKLHLPSRLTSNIINTLHDLKVINEVIIDKHNYVESLWSPGKQADKFTLGDLIDCIQNQGCSDFTYDYKHFFPAQWDTLQRMQQSAKTVGSEMLLRDYVCDLNNINKICKTLASEKKTFEWPWKRLKA